MAKYRILPLVWKWAACLALPLGLQAQAKTDIPAWKQEVFQTEKSFEAMCAQQGIAAAFAHFADKEAVIKRQDDTLISGKDNIRKFYDQEVYRNATVQWTPDFVEVSQGGDLAYTYGKYLWKIKGPDGIAQEFRGVFHTVWKRQADGSWKYVWD